MRRVTCPDCRGSVLQKAPACSGCGRPNPGRWPPSTADVAHASAPATVTLIPASQLTPETLPAPSQVADGTAERLDSERPPADRPADLRRRTTSGTQLSVSASTAVGVACPRCGCPNVFR